MHAESDLYLTLGGEQKERYPTAYIHKVKFPPPAILVFFVKIGNHSLGCYLPFIPFFTEHWID